MSQPKDYGAVICEEVKGGLLIRYDQMDAAKPPKGIKMAICPECNAPAKVKRGAKSTIWIHTAWKKKRHEQRRHYCKRSDDGRSLEMVIAVLPGPETPCGSTK